MSKAFTKEDDDGGLGDVLQVTDAALPPGTKNYVTPAGAARLRADIERLRAAPRSDPRRKLALDGQLAVLLRRLEEAEVVDPATQPQDRVLFGATVTVRDEDGGERRYRIVGVDEADPARGWVSWRTPIAAALMDLRVGESATVRGREVEVVGITYA